MKQGGFIAPHSKVSLSRGLASSLCLVFKDRFFSRFHSRLKQADLALPKSLLSCLRIRFSCLMATFVRLSEIEILSQTLALVKQRPQLLATSPLPPQKQALTAAEG